MDTARSPAASSFQGEPGTSAANIRMIGPIQLIIGFVSNGDPPGGPK
jgi:hypothetical protein